MLIQDNAALATFCEALRGAPYLAVDTEFLREKTFHAQLCLVQVAHGAHAAAIDVLAPGLDLAPLDALLLDPTVTKVFHAASQDLEIFFRRLGCVPTPVFDTQVGAAVCGFGEQPGYGTLVSGLLGVELDKTQQATDWSLRPLTERQVTYALGDVTWLCRVYEALVARLEASGRTGWVAEELAALEDPVRYTPAPREAWRRLRVRRPTRRTLAVLRELAAWREEVAMGRDLPRGWVVRDDALVEIAEQLPEDRDQLARVRTLKEGTARGRDGGALLDAVQRGLSSPEATWPEPSARRELQPGEGPKVALLQALLATRCEAHDVATSLVASREDLDLLVSEEAPDVPALHGWRREIFGADALRLRAGELALTCGPAGVVERGMGPPTAPRILS